MKTTTLNATPVDLIKIFGLILTVVEADNTRYVMIKPISDLLGLTWKHTRTTLFTDENTALFGTKQLNMLPLNELFAEEQEISPYYQGEKQVSNLPVFIQLNRVHLYLARVNTGKMRSHGKIEAADRLLALQQEWANALYQYETHGIAVKTSQHNTLKDLLRMRNMAFGEEKTRLTALIDAALTDMGATSDSPQRDLLN